MESNRQQKGEEVMGAAASNVEARDIVYDSPKECVRAAVAIVEGRRAAGGYSDDLAEDLTTALISELDRIHGDQQLRREWHEQPAARRTPRELLGNLSFTVSMSRESQRLERFMVPIRAALPGAEVYWEHTGGGCTCITVNLAERELPGAADDDPFQGFIWLTDLDGFWVFGFYAGLKSNPDLFSEARIYWPNPFPDTDSEDVHLEDFAAKVAELYHASERWLKWFTDRSDCCSEPKGYAADPRNDPVEQIICQGCGRPLVEVESKP